MGQKLIHRHHQFLRLILLISIVLLSACAPATQPAVTTPAMTAEATVTPVGAIAAEEEGNVFLVETTDSGRTIQHYLGETVVPLAPERIVSIDLADNLLALGITPIATGNWEPDFLGDLLTDIPTVGNAIEPNLEVIASLAPDLILLHTEGDDPLNQYALLSEIAPTVVVTDPEADFRLAIREVGLVLGLSDQTEERIAQYEARAATIREQVAAKIGSETVALINVRQDHYRLYGIKVGYTGPFLYGEMGMTPAPIVEELVPENANLTISLEVLPELANVDHIFVLYQTTLEEQWQGLQDQPLWQALPAVQAGQVYPITGNHWYASGLIPHEMKMADVINAFGLAGFDAEATNTEDAAEAEVATLECEEGYRYYDHEAILAPVCIPEVPERVITLEPFYGLQMAVQLQLPVVATGGDNSGIERYPTALTAEETEGIGFVGTLSEPNLEALALQTPDLIVGDAYNHTARYDLLNAIAPTVLINTADWKTWLTILGEIGGVPERATAALDEYHARVEEIKGRIKEGTVSFVRIQPDHFQLYRQAPDSYAPVAIMTEVGVVRTDFEVGTNENSWERLDWEGVLNLTGDTLFYVITGDPETSGQLETATIENALWQTLPAVQAGQAYRVNAEHWMVFGGLRSAHAVLDDIETYLTEE